MRSVTNTLISLAKKEKKMLIRFLLLSQVIPRNIFQTAVMILLKYGCWFAYITATTTDAFIIIYCCNLMGNQGQCMPNFSKTL